MSDKLGDNLHNTGDNNDAFKEEGSENNIEEFVNTSSNHKESVSSTNNNGHSDSPVNKYEVKEKALKSNAINLENFSLLKTGSQQFDTTSSLKCRIHGNTEIAIDIKTFKLACKKCVDEGNPYGDTLSREVENTELNTMENDIDEDMCEYHTNERIIFYCEDCKEILCKSCFHEHRNHKTSVPSVIIETLKQTLTENQNKLKQIQPKIEDNLKTMLDLNNQIKPFNSKTKNQIVDMIKNLEKLLKNKGEEDMKNFCKLYGGIDVDIEEAFKRLSSILKKCNKLMKEISDIDNNLKNQQSNIKICLYVQQVSGAVAEAKKIIADSKNFLGSKIYALKKRGDEELEIFKREFDASKKKVFTYEKSIVTSVSTGATSQSIRLRRFFKYTIDDLAYFSTTSIFLTVSHTICLSGLGICGLLKNKQDKDLKLSVSIKEYTGKELGRELLDDYISLGSVVNTSDPVITFYFTKVLTLVPGIIYVISCSNLENNNQYVEIWRGKVYLPTGTTELVQNIKCNNSKIDFRFLPSKGVESDFNEFGSGIISDLMYSYVN